MFGGLGHAHLGTSLALGAAFGAAFGLCFWLGFGKRANSPGAGLIWGLAFGCLVWLLLPAGLVPLVRVATRSANMLIGAQLRFPELVACLGAAGTAGGLDVGDRWRGAVARS